MFSKTLTIGIVAMSLSGFTSSAQAADLCSYRASLASLTSKNLSLTGVQKVRVAVAFPSNKDKGFYALETTALTGSQGISKGQTLKLTAPDVVIHLDQVAALNNESGALGGFDVYVAVQKPWLQGFAQDAANLFLNPGSGTEVLLQEQDIANSKKTDGDGLFDPKVLAFDEQGKSEIEIENQLVRLEILVQRQCF